MPGLKDGHTWIIDESSRSPQESCRNLPRYHWDFHFAARIRILIYRTPIRAARFLRRTFFQLPSPVSSDRVDAKQLLTPIYAALKPHALHRLSLRECEPDRELGLLRFRLEVVCDTGRAITSPLALSAEALRALQRKEFRMPGPKVIRLEDIVFGAFLRERGRALAR